MEKKCSEPPTSYNWKISPWTILNHQIGGTDTSKRHGSRSKLALTHTHIGMFCQTCTSTKGNTKLVMFSSMKNCCVKAKMGCPFSVANLYEYSDIKNNMVQENPVISRKQLQKTFQNLCQFPSQTCLLARFALLSHHRHKNPTVSQKANPIAIAGAFPETQ